MPFVLIIFSFISVFLCLQLIIISPKINIQSSFFFIYQCLTVMLVSFTMPANARLYAVGRGISASYEIFRPNAADLGARNPTICCGAQAAVYSFVSGSVILHFYHFVIQDCIKIASQIR